MTQKIMTCITPEDPRVSEVIKDHEELQLAMFMSKTLVSAIMNFTKREKKDSVPSGRLEFERFAIFTFSVTINFSVFTGNSFP